MAADATAVLPPAESLGRFAFSVTPRIQELLKAAAWSPGVAPELHDQFEGYAKQETVPWMLIQKACAAVKRQEQQQQQHPGPTAAPDGTSAPQPDRPQQHDSKASPSAAAICAGSRLVLPSPPVRQRSEQLKQRLTKLQEQLDSQRYAVMVADVTQDEQAAAAALADPFFPTTKLQLSFGLHVVVTMGTFFALGYYAGLLLLRSQSWAAACGCVGLVCGLLLETTLLIVRTNLPAPLEKKYGHLMGKTWEQQQQVNSKVETAPLIPPAHSDAQQQQHGRAVRRRRGA